MIIAHSEIKGLSEKLKEVVAAKERALKTTLESYNVWKDIDHFLNGLRSAIKKMQVAIFTEEKTIQNLKLKLQELAMIREINTSDVKAKKQAVVFLESKAAVSGSPEELTQLTDSINAYLNKLKKFVSGRLNGKWQPSRNGKQTERRPELPLESKTVAKHRSDKSVNAKFNSKAFNDALALIAAEAKPHPHRKPTYPFKRNEDMFNTKAVIEARKLLEMNDKEMEKHQIIEKLDCDISDLDKENKLDASFDSKELVRTMESLTKRKCSFCLDSKDLVHLDCCGEVCAKCIKRQMREKEPRILLTAYEAEKLQTFVCACPVHSTGLGVEVLQQIFDPRELEKLSIEALKRQQQVSARRKMKCPNICVECKCVVQNDMLREGKKCRKCYMAKYLARK